MAIYHLHDKSVGRKSGRSPIAMAAYRAGAILTETVLDIESGVKDEIMHDYSKKANVIYSEILAPGHAPDWVRDRNKLWNNVKDYEKRKDAVYLHDMDIAIPKELNEKQAIQLVKAYLQKNFVDKGIIIDFSIHWERGNPHVHVMQTTREITPNGFGKKNREWHRKKGLYEKRKAWAEIANEYLLKNGFNVRIDHRSYKEQGIDLLPSRHEGIISDQLEYKGIISELRLENEKRIKENVNKLDKNPDIILEKLSAIKATFTKVEIAQCIFSFTRGNEESFDRLLYKVLNSKKIVLVTKGDLQEEVRYSYKNYIEKETNMFTHVEKLNNRPSFDKIDKAKEKFLEKLFTKTALSLEQQQAVYHLLNSNNIAVMIGKAGTGKTRTLSVVADYYKKQGVMVRAGAVAGIAAANLAAELRVEARTLASWFAGMEKGLQKRPVFSKPDVWIIDEAGMIGTEDMEKLLSLVKARKDKILLIGDSEQFSPIGAGGALRGIVNVIGKTELSTIYRQKKEWQQKATIHLSKGEVEEALYLYNKHNKVFFDSNSKGAIAHCIRDYTRHIIKEKENKILDNKSIIIAFTNEEVAEINRRIREKLKLAGYLHTEHIINTKTGKKPFSVGDKILFTKNDDKVLKVKNGSIGVIKRINSFSEIIVELADNRTIKFSARDYNNFSHGYACTAYKEQGVTVDYAYVLLNKFYSAESLYVAMSRHKSDMKIYVDKESFSDLAKASLQIARSAKKDLAKDYNKSEQNNKRYIRVKAYKDVMLTVRNLMEEIYSWADETGKTVIKHKKWKELLSKIEERNSLAKQISADMTESRIFLRQAGIHVSTVKNHTGQAKIFLTELEEKEKLQVKEYAKYCLIVRELANLLKDRDNIKQENNELWREYKRQKLLRNKTADNIILTRRRNNNLYRLWFKEENIEWSSLYKHAKEFIKQCENNKILKDGTYLEKYNLLANKDISLKLLPIIASKDFADYIEKRTFVLQAQDEENMVIINDITNKINHYKQLIKEQNNIIILKEHLFNNIFVDKKKAIELLTNYVNNHNLSMLQEKIKLQSNHFGTLKKAHKKYNIGEEIAAFIEAKKLSLDAKEKIRGFKRRKDYLNALAKKEELAKQKGNFALDTYLERVEEIFAKQKIITIHYDIKQLLEQLEKKQIINDKILIPVLEHYSAVKSVIEKCVTLDKKIFVLEQNNNASKRNEEQYKLLYDDIASDVKKTLDKLDNTQIINDIDKQDVNKMKEFLQHLEQKRIANEKRRSFFKKVQQHHTTRTLANLKNKLNELIRYAEYIKQEQQKRVNNTKEINLTKKSIIQAGYAKKFIAKKQNELAKCKESLKTVFSEENFKQIEQSNKLKEIITKHCKSLAEDKIFSKNIADIGSFLEI